MREDTVRTEAGEQYAAAHTAHYTTKNLREALELYKGVMAAYPESNEAGYARSQIRNIVSALVPEEELFDAQVELVRAQFEHGDRLDPDAVDVVPQAS